MRLLLPYRLHFYASSLSSIRFLANFAVALAPGINRVVPEL